MCLLLKLLQIQPEKEILIEYLQAEDFKCVALFIDVGVEVLMPRRYLRALAAIYIRMTFRPVEVYELLEPLMKDYRKLRVRSMGALRLSFSVFSLTNCIFDRGLLSNLH